MKSSQTVFKNLHKNTEVKLILALTVVIWSVYFVVRYLVNQSMDEYWTIPPFLIVCVTGTTLMWLIARKLKSLPLIWIFVLGPPLAFIVEFIALQTSFKLYHGEFLWPSSEQELAGLVLTLYWASLLFLLWYLGYFAIVNYYRFVRESLAASQARAQANEAQLEMLRYQINPHFLFNTLNSISSLVLDNKNDKAENMIGGLSRFLRFSLDRVPNVLTPLSDEIAVIEEYLSIEEIRFSRKLKTEYDIDPDTLDCLVPPLILQPAIENAIKHGIAPLKSDAKIIVRARILKNKLNLCIIDSGQGLSEPAKFGVGMRNMQERLKALYGSAGSLTLENDRELGGAKACLLIPVSRQSNEEEEA